LTIQPLTNTIGLVESDDALSEQNNRQNEEHEEERAAVIRTQPTSANLRVSLEDIGKEEDLECSVRRTSGKTNSHILSDYENSITSTPKVLLSKEPTSNDIQSVKNEIAQIQSTLESVRKEMEEFQKLKSSKTNTPAHVITNNSRPPSVNSNKTFVYETDDTEATNAASASQVVVIEESVKSRPLTSKSILKNDSPFKRIATPTPDDVLDNHSSHVEIHEHDEEISEATHDEVDQSSSLVDPLMLIRSDTAISLNHESIIEDEEADEDEIVDTETDYREESQSPMPQEIVIQAQRTPIKANRPAVLKRSHKTTPIKNSMPNIHPAPTVVIRTAKVNTLYPPSLRRFERPKDAMNTCLSQLESSSWEEVMEGLKNFVRLIRHHPAYIDPHVHIFVIALSKQVKNLRSQVSRAACSAASEFFMTHSKVLDADAEELTAALLNRSADTNKFLRSDAAQGNYY
jgi:hypothetical protein